MRQKKKVAIYVAMISIIFLSFWIIHSDAQAAKSTKFLSEVMVSSDKDELIRNGYSVLENVKIGSTREKVYIGIKTSTNPAKDNYDVMIKGQDSSKESSNDTASIFGQGSLAVVAGIFGLLVGIGGTILFRTQNKKEVI